MPSRFAVVGAALLAANFGGLLAQQTVASPAPAPCLPGWEVTLGRTECSLFATSGRKFSIELSGSDGKATLLVMHFTSSDFRTQTAEVILQPSGTSYGEDYNAMWMPGGFAVFNLPTGFVEELTRSNRLIVNINRKKKFDFSFARAREAVDVLRYCHDRLQRSWGIDPAQLRSLSKFPKPIDEWFDSKEMIKQIKWITHRAASVATFTVQPTGRVTDCRTVASAGRADIDAVNCNSLIAHARFEPATDALSKPIPARIAARELQWVSIRGRNGWKADVSARPFGPDGVRPFAAGSRSGGQ